MSDDLRSRVAPMLAAELRRMQDDAAKAKPAALARRATLRQSVDGAFGRRPRADAELLAMVRLPEDENGEPPELDWPLGRLLDDASLVGGLVAATRVKVAPPPEKERLGRCGSLGRDMRKLRGTRSSADALISSLLRASREQLPRPLRRTLTLMADDGAALDARTLLLDLQHWDGDDRRVQKRWAYHFWTGSPTPPGDQDEHEETA